MITVKRKAICNVLRNVEVEKPIKLPYTTKEIVELVFDTKEDDDGTKYFVFNQIIFKILSKIDCTNIPMENVVLAHLNLSNVRTLKFNPQHIYQKDLSQTQLNDGIEIIGNDNVNQKDLFQGVKINGTHFNGCKNVKINPQTIFEKELSKTSLQGVDFTGYSFDGCTLWETDFKGAVGAKINPNKVRNFDYVKSLESVELTDLPEEDRNYHTMACSNYQELQNKMVSLQMLFKELIKEQLPEEKEEIKETPEKQPEPPKQKKKWFGN